MFLKMQENQGFFTQSFIFLRYYIMMFSVRKNEKSS